MADGRRWCRRVERRLSTTLDSRPPLGLPHGSLDPAGSSRHRRPSRVDTAALASRIEGRNHRFMDQRRKLADSDPDARLESGDSACPQVRRRWHSWSAAALTPSNGRRTPSSHPPSNGSRCRRVRRQYRPCGGSLTAGSGGATAAEGGVEVQFGGDVVISRRNRPPPQSLKESQPSDRCTSDFYTTAGTGQYVNTCLPSTMAGMANATAGPKPIANRDGQRGGRQHAARPRCWHQAANRRQSEL